MSPQMKKLLIYSALRRSYWTMKKAFDAVSWMRQRRTQIDEEDATLTWTEKREKTHEQILQDPILSRLSKKTRVSGKVARRV